MTPSSDHITGGAGPHISQTPASPGSLSQGQKLDHCDQDGWAVTSSKAKKVKWSQRQTVLPSPSSVEQPWESQSPVGHSKVRTEEEGREGLPLSSPSAPWKPVACSFLILETSSKPTFSHIPEYTGENHVLKPESVSQKRREAGKGERREDGALPGVCMCPKRKLSIAYMGD